MVASSLSNQEVAAGRRNLAEVLAFLERRGASPAVLEMAMMRSGLTPEVARLLSQCVASGELVPLDQELALSGDGPAPPTATPDPTDTGAASAKALRWLAGTALVWAGLLIAGLGLGFALGMEMGVAQGFDDGMDRFQAALQLALER